MISLELMKEYVHAADELEQAQHEIAKWESVAAKAKVRMEQVAAKMGEPVERPVPVVVSHSGTSDAEIKERALKANKKVRGEATLAILKALPGTLPQVVERTGIKKTTASTLIARLQHDGLVKKTGSERIPGYESRTTTVYDMAV
jgi:hypothetical protein